MTTIQEKKETFKTCGLKASAYRKHKTTDELETIRTIFCLHNNFHLLTSIEKELKS